MAMVGGEEGTQRREAVGRQGGLGRGQLRRLAPLFHGPERGSRVGEAGRVDSLAAQSLVGVPHGIAQPRRVEARREAGGGSVTGLDDLVQRGGERSLAQPLGLELVEDAESRVHARGDRMHGQNAPAEPVHGRDPRPLPFACGASKIPRALGLAGIGGSP